MWTAEKKGRGKNRHDARQQLLSKIESGRCWTGCSLFHLDFGRGDADSEPCPEWTRHAVGPCTIASVPNSVSRARDAGRGHTGDGGADSVRPGAIS
eukprot:801730-Pyramimonas_sp.AAC.1